MLQAGIQVLSEEELQLQGGNSVHAAGAKTETIRAKNYPCHQKTCLPRCDGTGLGKRSNPIPRAKFIRQSHLPGSRRPSSHPCSSLDFPCCLRAAAPASQLPKAGSKMREG